MNQAIVLAAGRSSRLGRSKALLPVPSKPVIDLLVESLTQGGAERVLVVIAEGDETLVRHCQERDLAWTRNPHPEYGMLSSVQCGLRALPEHTADRVAILICPVDYPQLHPQTIHRLIAAIAEHSHETAVPICEGRRGHPLALSAEACRRVDQLDPNIGLRQLLQQHPPHEVRVEDRGTLRDLDTWADYNRLIESDRD